jgi:hypothetical protein
MYDAYIYLFFIFESSFVWDGNEEQKDNIFMDNKNFIHHKTKAVIVVVVIV